ncbi:MAG: potassium channel protein [Acidobacteriota bacterium]|jgi:voltage-gated potassium channel|nr:potassium channel protein [Acidobacteriota bacterium]
MKKTSRMTILTMLLLALLAVDTVGYMLIEQATIGDSLYMTLISITTVGYHEVFPLSRAGKAFTIFVILSGLGLVFSIASTVVEHGVESRVRSVLGRRRMKALSNMKNHIVIAGYGRMGEIVARELSDHDLDCLIIDPDPQRFALAEERGHRVIRADATHEDVLEQCGIRTARAFIALLSTDAENLFAVLTVKEMNPGLTIIARALDVQNEVKLRRIGAHRVIAPNLLSSKRIVNSVLRPNVVDLMDIVSQPGMLDLSLEEIIIEPDSDLNGKSVRRSQLRERYEAMVVAIRRGADMRFNPGPDEVFRTGDIVILLGPTTRIRRAGQGE